MVQILGDKTGLEVKSHDIEGRDIAGRDIESILERLEQIDNLPEDVIFQTAKALAAEQVRMGEIILETWIVARDGHPEDKLKEGFRILALHAQGAKGVPSFNACRETCREIVFQHNVVLQAAEKELRLKPLRMMSMVVRHLALFVSGKLEVAGLGDFCCASKPLHQSGDSLASQKG